MVFAPIKPRLVVRNISKFDVNILDRVKIRPGQERDIYSELEYDDFGSLTSMILKELESPSGEIYRLWKVLDAIRIIDFVNPTHVGSGISAESFSTSNEYFEGAVLGYESGELKWLTPGGSGGGVTSVTAAAPLSSSGGATPNISLGTVGVANGGTGQTSLTANAVLLGNGALGFQTVAPGTAGNVLTSDGTMWSSAPAPATGVTSVSASSPLSSSGGATPDISFSGWPADVVGALTNDGSGGLSWVPVTPTPPGGGLGDLQINDGAGGFAGSTDLSFVANSLEVNNTVRVTDGGNTLSVQSTSIGADAATLTVDAGTTVQVGGVATVNISGAYTLPGADGAVGEVMTTNGAGVTSWTAPAGGPPSGAAGGDLTGSTYPNPIISSFGGKTHWVVQGGKYATLQAAVDAAAAEDIILVGPKTTGDWGNVVLNVVNKPLIIAATSGAGANKIVKIGSVTYDLGTTGPVLNVNLNETYLYGLYIQGSFTGSAVTLTGGANYPGRLRLYGCYILNSSSTGEAAVTNSNLGANSSLYLDSCVVSLPNSTTGSAVVQTAGYTIIRNRCDVSGSSAASATGNAINASSGTVEIYDSYISIPVRAGAVVGYPTINVTGATTFVSAGYSTILNGSDAAGAACANIGTAGARFGAGDATLAAGTTLPTSAVAVSGVAGGSFLYANVSFSFVSTVSTVTSTATPQSGGLFSYGLSVGTLLGTTFAVNASGNITKINNVTTSFPSAQGSANQVLTNNGSGTLTWSNGNLRSLGSCPASPTAASLRTNATYTVNVAAVALPAMAAGDDGLTISLVNISGAGSTVTPSTGVARTMTTGGGQTWVWRNTGTTWYCISNV